jgi:hypothetical protein
MYHPRKQRGEWMASNSAPSDGTRRIEGDSKTTVSQSLLRLVAVETEVN